jgi:phosphatidylserine decarboxylase
MLNSIFPKIHKEGYKFLAIAIIITFFVLLISKAIGFILILITVWVYYFFRDPERFSINDDKYLVSPADGLISDIKEVSGPIELGLENNSFTRVSIFMNIFNCHVNRVPTKGTVEEIFYKPGKFLNASLDKASEENERNYYKIKLPNGEKIIIVQIAGLIARRIVCEVKKDQSWSKCCSW